MPLGAPTPTPTSRRGAPRLSTDSARALFVPSLSLSRGVLCVCLPACLASERSSAPLVLSLSLAHPAPVCATTPPRLPPVTHPAMSSRRRAKSPAARSTAPNSEAAAFVTEYAGDRSQTWMLSADGKLIRSSPNHGQQQQKKNGNARKAPASKSQTSMVSRIAAELKSIFLPAGYPDSVRAEYLQFQLYDTVQAACSYLRNVLTTSALLKAAGVGEGTASPMAAALTWVLRDGFGMFGSLLFSYYAGANFDVHVKEWRLFADLINDVGLTLDMLAPLSGDYYALTAAIGALCKTICGMVAGATRASITAHFALRGNLADVSAKENAQETAVNLLGLMIGSVAARWLGDSALAAWLAFAVLTILHVWANWRGVGSLTFEHLNGQRARLVTRAWWMQDHHVDAGCRMQDHHVARHAHVTEADLTPFAIARQERIWQPLVTWISAPKVGVGVEALASSSHPRQEGLRDASGAGSSGGKALGLAGLNHVFRDQHYLLRIDANGAPAVAFRPSATDATALFALLHTSLLSLPSCDMEPILRAAGGTMRYGAVGARSWAEEEALLVDSLHLCEREWPRFETIVKKHWREASVPMAHFGRRRVHIERV